MHMKSEITKAMQILKTQVCQIASRLQTSTRYPPSLQLLYDPKYHLLDAYLVLNRAYETSVRKQSAYVKGSSCRIRQYQARIAHITMYINLTFMTSYDSLPLLFMQFKSYSKQDPPQSTMQRH